MGTSGSGAGGGSGGFGGGRGRGGGAITISRAGIKEVDPAEQKAKTAFQSAFSRLSTDYIHFMVGDPGVVAAYEALRTIHVHLVQNKSWKGIEERFGISGRPGCLRLLPEALTRDDGPIAMHPRVQAPLRAALMDFFRRIVGGDPVVAQTGNAADVMAALDPRPFQSTSALFLGSYLFEVLRLEDSSLTKLGRERLREFALLKANEVVAAFERAYKGRPWKGRAAVGFGDFLQVLQGEPEWLAAQLRKAQ